MESVRPACVRVLQLVCQLYARLCVRCALRRADGRHLSFFGGGAYRSSPDIPPLIILPALYLHLT